MDGLPTLFAGSTRVHREEPIMLVVHYFEDMAIYSMVKNNTFNGIPLPSIYSLKTNGEFELIKKFGYSDFKERLS